MIDIGLIKDYWFDILCGTLVTLEITLFSCCVGGIGGTLIGVLKAYAPRSIQWPMNILVGCIKGTPLLIQITFAYFLLPYLGITLPAFWTAVLAIGINSSAYLSSVVYAGIQSVPYGQIEAAQVLGFSRLQIVRFIVLPQAFMAVMPALGNELITLIKDSSLASIIGVMELAKEASIIRSRTYDVMTTYLIVAVIYIVLTNSLSALMHLAKKRMKHVTT